MKRSLGILLVLGVLLGASQVLAFDGDRQGFVLDLGLGFGQGKLKASMGSVESSVDATGGAAVLRIGGGLGRQTVVTFTARAVSYKPSIEYTDPFTGTTTTVEGDLGNGFSGVEISYFLKPQAPSFFFTGGLGAGVYMDNDTDESESGFGLSLGGGYEFATNWVLEANIFGAKVAEIMGTDMTISAATFTISWFAY